jgi:excisionase family DNA binding protein
MSASHVPPRRGLTVKQFEQASGLSHATIYRLIAAGKIKTVKVLGRRIIPETTLDALLEEGVQ